MNSEWTRIKRQKIENSLSLLYLRLFASSACQFSALSCVLALRGDVAFSPPTSQFPRQHNHDLRAFGECFGTGFAHQLSLSELLSTDVRAWRWGKSTPNEFALFGLIKLASSIPQSNVKSAPAKTYNRRALAFFFSRRAHLVGSLVRRFPFCVQSAIHLHRTLGPGGGDILWFELRSPASPALWRRGASRRRRWDDKRLGSYLPDRFGFVRPCQAG